MMMKATTVTELLPPQPTTCFSHGSGVPFFGGCAQMVTPQLLHVLPLPLLSIDMSMLTCCLFDGIILLCNQ
jgi:hypothetical protein